MQFARDVAESRLLRRDQLLREFSALLRHNCELAEQSTIGADNQRACKHDGCKRRDQKDIGLALDAIVDRCDPLLRLLLAFIIGHEKTCNGIAQSSLPRLQRCEYLLSCLSFVASPSQYEHLSHRIPELGNRVAQILPLRRGARRS